MAGTGRSFGELFSVYCLDPFERLDCYLEICRELCDDKSSQVASILSGLSRLGLTFKLMILFL